MQGDAARRAINHFELYGERIYETCDSTIRGKINREEDGKRKREGRRERDRKTKRENKTIRVLKVGRQVERRFAKQTLRKVRKKRRNRGGKWKRSIATGRRGDDAAGKKSKTNEREERKERNGRSGNEGEEEEEAIALRLPASAKSAAPAALFLLRWISIALHTIAILRGA